MGIKNKMKTYFTSKVSNKNYDKKSSKEGEGKNRRPF